MTDSTSAQLLVIDDEPVFHAALAGLLANENYRLHAIADPRTAQEAARRIRPDVIILDVMMPELDGYTLCRALRADPITADIPILMATALDDRDSRLQGLDAGADDFLGKPIDGIELRIRLRATLRLNRHGRLRRERARSHWVMEQSADGYVSVDAQGRIRDANPAARRFLDLPEAPTVVSCVPLADIVRATFRIAPGWDTGDAALPAPGTQSHWLRPATALDNPLWLRLEAIALPEDGTGDRLFRLCDCTEQVHARRDVHCFRLAVSHKLRNPLTPLITGLDLLAESRVVDADPDARELVQCTRDGARELNARIVQALAWIDAPLTAHSGVAVRWCLLPGMISEMAVAAACPAVTVRLGSGPLVGTAPLSAASVQLILTELFTNALKFHPTHAPTVVVDILRNPAVFGTADTITLVVTDDGVNVPTDRLSAVWYPLYQVEKTFTGEVPGMGLGLPLIACLVHEAGGAVQIANRADRPGVRVEVTLPVQAE